MNNSFDDVITYYYKNLNARGGAISEDVLGKLSEILMREYGFSRSEADIFLSESLSRWKISRGEFSYYYYLSSYIEEVKWLANFITQFKMADVY